MDKHLIRTVGWVAVGGLCACGPSTTEQRRPGTTAAAVQESSESTADPSALTPEKLDELNQFFYRKMGPIQFRCYNDEVEKTHKKYQGNLGLSIMVVPGGKVSSVKITSSSLEAPGIEQCVVEEVKQWEWPEVPTPTPFAGSINFKPAW
jgi:hypothetical protein